MERNLSSMASISETDGMKFEEVIEIILISKNFY